MSQKIKRVLVAGGTGNIGTYLCTALSAKGYDVSIITRGGRQMISQKPVFKTIDKALFGFLSKKYPNVAKPSDFTKYSWSDIKKDGLPSRTDAVINLSGHPIGYPGIFMEGLKNRITVSRIETNDTIRKAIENSENPPKVFISASAVGIYDLSTDIEYTEEMVPNVTETFFTTLCNDWEQSSVLPQTISTRVVNLRFGVNLAHDTYPMHPLLIPTFARGMGGVVGSGKQPFPWIHVQDSVGIILLVLEKEEIRGPVNVVAPSLDDNEEFTKQLGAAVKMPKQRWPLLPQMVSKLYGAERAPLILEGQKVVPKKVLDHGYQFKYPTLVSAFDEIVKSYPHFKKKQKDRIFGGKE